MTPLGFLLSILAGAIAGLAILPIASDSIRGRLLGGKKRVLLAAQSELYEAVQEMVLSGQVIGDHTFNKLAENISKKYEVPASALGDKDDSLAAALRAISLSKVLPPDIKKEMSGYVQAQLEGEHVNYNKFLEAPTLTDAIVTEVAEEWRTEKPHAGMDTYTRWRENIFIGLVVLLVGCLVTATVYFLDLYIVLPIIICVSCFLICISILISLIGTKEKDLEFFRRLVYKIITLIVLMVFLVVAIAFLR